ncbi:MAG: hypothetical protein HOQ22_19515, partial [Nocardioidaceae bacterium]|nr:hypothetical protein [Nocardioidaceae bacterium]
MSGGRRRAEKPRRQRRTGAVLSTLALALGTLACFGAWFFLVRAAIDFGQAARTGSVPAWGFCGAATVGATLCLLLVFVLGARIWAQVGLVRAA